MDNQNSFTKRGVYQQEELKQCKKHKTNKELRKEKYLQKKKQQHRLSSGDQDATNDNSVVVRNERVEWFRQNQTWATLVTMEDVIDCSTVNVVNFSNDLNTASTSSNSNCDGTNRYLQKNTQTVLSQLLCPYYNLQQHDRKQGTATAGKIAFMKDFESGDQQYFIAEGTETIRLLIKELDYQKQKQLEDKVMYDNKFSLQLIQIQSIFVKSTLLFNEPVRILNDIESLQRTCFLSKAWSSDENNDDDCSRNHVQPQQLQPPPFHVLVGTEDVMSTIAGFPISRGVLACGIIPTKYNEEWMFGYIQQQLQRQHPFSYKSNDKTNCKDKNSIRILALDGICDTSNLGSIIRTCSAFGITCMLISSNSCDPWYRQSVRVSMGHVVRIPCIRVKQLSKTIQQLLNDYSIQSYAAVATTNHSTLQLDELQQGNLHNVL